MLNIGLILKNARENKNLTQAAVMDITGINRKSLSGYENNVAEPDLDTFATLAALYGISVDTALGIKPPEDSIMSLSKFEQQLLKKVVLLDREHQAELLALIDVMAKYSLKK